MSKIGKLLYFGQLAKQDQTRRVTLGVWPVIISAFEIDKFHPATLIPRSH